ncbi:MAG: hypothetical protein U0871_00940 [Gemmataceae bacterium]
MALIGTTTGRTYAPGRLVARAGEGSVFRVEGHEALLLKVLTRPLTARAVEKLQTLAAIQPRPGYTALPVEVVVDPSTAQAVGFVQPYFGRAVPLTRVLDTHGRAALKLPDDLAFRVKLCRLLADAFTRVHQAHLVVGDVSDGNFLLGRDRLGRAWVVYVIDCNSFQVTVRTPRGNEVFVSGVATEAYAAPEVQPTDWATSLRSVHSDAFGLAVLAWKLLFGGSHPFAVVTPRSVDVPPLGERVARRLFPFRPGTPLPPGWAAPDLRPPLTVLSAEVRELFFRTFSAADPRDRPPAGEWAAVFRSWEVALTPSLPLRVLGAWNGSVADRLAVGLSAAKPYLGRVAVLVTLAALTAWTARRESPPAGLPAALQATPAAYRRLLSPPRPFPNRPRPVDLDLFPEPVWNPLPPPTE